MRQFIQETVWLKLEDNELMYCPLTGDAIVDMSIYTKHRQFRIPGSSKSKYYVALELPTRDFLMKARIVDRQGKPDATARDLGFEARAGCQVSRRCQQPRLLPQLICNEKDVAQKNKNAALIESMLRAHGDISTKVIVDGYGRYVDRNGSSGRKCLIAGEHTVSDNCWFRITGGIV